MRSVAREIEEIFPSDEPSTGARRPNCDRNAVGRRICTMSQIERVASNTPWEPVFGYVRKVKAGNWLAISGTTATDERGMVDRRRPDVCAGTPGAGEP